MCMKMNVTPRGEALNAVRRASDRAAALVHIDMKRRLTSLAAIASTAPLVGMFGTLVGIISSFKGSAGDKLTYMALIAQGLSESLLWTGLGLLVAGLALLCYKYLLAKVDRFDYEIENATLQLMNDLACFR